jgi:uncharacterized membrane protein SpoIIM required for sporulation
MTSANLRDLLTERRPAWKRLGELLNTIQRKGPRRCETAQVQELIRLYRETAADLARLRTLRADPQEVAHVNRLVAASHGLIYRGDRRRRSGGLLRFFAREYPRLVRQTWAYSLTSFLIGAAFAGMAFVTVQHSPEVVSDIMGGGDAEFLERHSADDIRQRFQVLPSHMLSGFVTTNNIRVAILAFALGITYGLGTVYVLAVNGVMLGGFAGAYARSGVGGDFWLTVLPHGALELSAIVLAGGSGLLLGHALWRPGDRTRRLALRETAAVSVQLAVGLIPAFIVAGLIEGFVTPSREMSQELKLGLGILAAAVFWTYVLLAGRGPAAHEAPGEASRDAPATAAVGPS